MAKRVAVVAVVAGDEHHSGATTGEKITVGAGVTISLGGYEFVRIDTTYETAVRTRETGDQAWARAWADVEAEINRKEAEVRQQRL